MFDFSNVVDVARTRRGYFLDTMGRQKLLKMGNYRILKVSGVSMIKTNKRYSLYLPFISSIIFYIIHSEIDKLQFEQSTRV